MCRKIYLFSSQFFQMVICFNKFKYFYKVRFELRTFIDLIYTFRKMNMHQCRYFFTVQPLIVEIFFIDEIVYQCSDLTLFKYSIVLGCYLTYLFDGFGLRHLKIPLVLFQSALNDMA